MIWFFQQVLWAAGFALLVPLKKWAHEKWGSPPKLDGLIPSFEAELGTWPAVFKATDGYVLYAPYASPSRPDPNIFPVGACAVIIIASLIAGTKSYVGAACGIAFSIWSFNFWKDICIVRLVVTFITEEGRYSWLDPNGQFHAVSFDEWQEFRIAAHREGPEQQRRDELTMRRRQEAYARAQQRDAQIAADNRGKRPIHQDHSQGMTSFGTGIVAALPIAPTYQTASELLVQTGYGGRNWRVLSEIRDDQPGQWAYLLQTAIEFVREQARLERDALQARPLLPRPATPTHNDDDEI